VEEKKKSDERQKLIDESKQKLEETKRLMDEKKKANGTFKDEEENKADSPKEQIISEYDE